MKEYNSRYVALTYIKRKNIYYMILFNTCQILWIFTLFTANNTWNVFFCLFTFFIIILWLYFCDKRVGPGWPFFVFICCPFLCLQAGIEEMTFRTFYFLEYFLFILKIFFFVKRVGPGWSAGANKRREVPIIDQVGTTLKPHHF